MGGSESGSTDGARGGMGGGKPPVEERTSREGVSIGHELFSSTSLFSLFCRVSLPSSGTFFFSHPQKSTATVAQVPKESPSLFMSLLPLSSLPLFLSDFQYLSSFLKCCFFKVSPNNSALELYFASLFMFTRTICVLWIKVLFSGRRRLLIYLLFFLIINRQDC